MGTDIHVLREINVDGNWIALENPYGENKEDINPNSIKPYYGDRNYGLFTILSDVRGMSCEGNVFEYPNGVASNSSDLVKEAVERDKEYTYSTSNCLISDLEKFRDNIRNKIIELGYFPEDMVYDGDLEDLNKFDSGMYKDDLEKRLNVMLRIYDNENYITRFINELYAEPINKEISEKYNIDGFGDKNIPSTWKRITIYYDS